MLSPAVLGGRVRRQRDVGFRWMVVDALIAVWRGLRIGRLGRLGHYVLVLPAVLFVSVLAAGLVLAAWRSVHTFDAYRLISGGFSLEYYREAVTDPFYRRIFLRTIGGSLIVTVVAVALALPLSYAIVTTRTRFLRSLLLFTALVPFLVGEVVRAYSWLVMLGAKGAVPSTTRALGLGSVYLMGTFPGVVIGLVQVMIPLSALTLLPSMRAIDPELQQAAATMGARPWRTWRTVVLPLARPGIVGACALSFALSMTTYAIPALVGRGVMDFAANTIQDAYFGEGNSHLGAALGVIVLAVVLAGVGVITAFGNGQGRRRRRAAGGRAR